MILQISILNTGTCFTIAMWSHWNFRGMVPSLHVIISFKLLCYSLWIVIACYNSWIPKPQICDSSSSKVFSYLAGSAFSKIIPFPEAQSISNIHNSKIHSTNISSISWISSHPWPSDAPKSTDINRHLFPVCQLESPWIGDQPTSIAIPRWPTSVTPVPCCGALGRRWRSPGTTALATRRSVRGSRRRAARWAKRTAGGRWLGVILWNVWYINNNNFICVYIYICIYVCIYILYIYCMYLWYGYKGNDMSNCFRMYFDGSLIQIYIYIILDINIYIYVYTDLLYLIFNIWNIILYIYIYYLSIIYRIWRE